MELTKEHFDKTIKGLTTKKDFEGLQTFIRKHTVTNAELKEALATLPTRKQIDKLTTAIDRLAKQAITKSDEKQALQHRLDTMHEWIEKASPRVGIKYEV